MDTVWIRFVQDRTVQDEHRGTPQQTSYRTGQELAVDPRAAQHWISRGVAIRIADPSPSPPPAAPTETEAAGPSARDSPVRPRPERRAPASQRPTDARTQQTQQTPATQQKGKEQLMKIKLTVDNPHAAVPGKIGDIVEVEEGRAHQLIDAGQAEVVEDQPAADQPAAEKD